MLRILITLIMLAMAAPAAFAASNQQMRDSGEKLTNGAGNIATGWTELPKEIGHESEQSNAALGLTRGAVAGTGKAVEKTLSGVADTATFFIPD